MGAEAATLDKVKQTTGPNGSLEITSGRISAISGLASVTRAP
jgi:hypothetical protein